MERVTAHKHKTKEIVHESPSPTPAEAASQESRIDSTKEVIDRAIFLIGTIDILLGEEVAKSS